MGATVIEVLNPLSTVGKHDMAELPRKNNLCLVQYGIGADFSLTNPEYSSPIFLSYYPEFSCLLKTDGQYMQLFDTLYKMANNCLDYRRFGYDWYYLMSAFIAHYMALSLQKLYAINNLGTNADITQIIGAIGNQGVGLTVKESLGGEEVQTEQMINVGVFRGAGNFMTTPYGREFWDKYYGYSRNFIRGVY